MRLADVRDAASALGDEPRKHLLVSELLGSFGCNELSPECLEACIHTLGRPGCIVMPRVRLNAPIIIIY